MDLIRNGPVRLRMNNGDEYIIPNSEFAIVDDMNAYILVKKDDGRLKSRLLSLVCICSAEPCELAER